MQVPIGSNWLVSRDTRLARRLDSAVSCKVTDLSRACFSRALRASGYSVRAWRKIQTFNQHFLKSENGVSIFCNKFELRFVIIWK